MVKKIIEQVIKFYTFKIKKYNVVAILGKEGQLFPSKLIYAKNLVTDDGDLYYAQKSAGEAADNAYVGMRLGISTASTDKADSDVNTENSAGRKVLDATYPKTDDGDADNTGSGTDIVTWRVSYTTSEGNINDIAEGAIVDDITTPTSALAHWLFSVPFSKTSSDTLKVIVNHRFNGV